MTARVTRLEAAVAEIHANRGLSDERFAFLQKMTDEVDRRYRERFEALDRAVGKSEQIIDRRFDAVNDIRTQMAHLLPRAEATALFEGMEGRIEQGARATAARLQSIAETQAALSNVMTALRSSLQGQDEGELELQGQIESRQKEKDRSRNLVLGLFAAAMAFGGICIAIATVIVSIWLGTRSNTPSPVPPAPTTTTVTR